MLKIPCSWIELIIMHLWCKFLSHISHRSHACVQLLYILKTALDVYQYILLYLLYIITYNFIIWRKFRFCTCIKFPICYLVLREKVHILPRYVYQISLPKKEFTELRSSSNYCLTGAVHGSCCVSQHHVLIGCFETNSSLAMLSYILIESLVLCDNWTGMVNRDILKNLKVSDNLHQPDLVKKYK